MKASCQWLKDYCAFDLPAHISRPLAPVGETGSFHIDLVQLHPAIDIRIAHQFGCCAVQQIRVVRAQDHSVEEIHHIEGRADHGLVLAVREDLRNRSELIADVSDDVHLATHVMCRLCLGAVRWAAKHEIAAGVVQEVGEVRGALGKLLDLRLGIG